METSILVSIKKLIGIAETDDSFDSQLIFHINAVFMILTQMGVGPSNGFSISDDTSNWSDFIAESEKPIENLEAVKFYISAKVRLAFDPPTSSAMLDALKGLISEYEWRLNVAVDPEDTFK